MKKLFSLKQLRVSRKQNKILNQILLSNTTIAFLSVIAIGIILTNTSRSFFYENFHNAATSRLEKTASYTDEYMNSILKIFRLAEVNSSRFNVYNQLSSDKKSMLEFYEWISDFSQYIASYDDISSMWIYNNSSVTDILSRSSMQPSEFPDWDYLSSLTERAKQSYQYMIPFVCEYNDDENSLKSGISIISPLVPNDSTYVHGSIVINLNSDNLKKALLTKTDEAAETSYIYNKATGEIIMSCNADPSAALLKPSEIYNHLKGSNKIKLDGKNYTFNTIPSEIFSDWVYISTYDCSALNENLSRIIRRIVLIIVLFAIVELILSALLAFKIYIPINNCLTNIKNLFSAASDSDHETSDELTTINKYLDNLEEQNSLKDGIITKFIPSVKSLVLKNALKGCYKDVIALNTALTDCKTHFIYTDIIISVIISDKIPAENPDFSAADQRIQEAFKSSFPYFIGEHIENGLFVYILNVPAKTKPEELNTLHSICGEDMSFSQAVSDVFDDFEAIPEKYDSALDRCRSKFINPPQTFYLPSENISLLPVIDSKLINSIISEPSDAYNEILGKYLKKPEAFSCSSFLSFIDVLFNNLSMRLLQNKSNADLHRWQNALKNDCLYGSTEDFRTHLDSLSEFLSETTFSKKKAELSVQIKKYISENLDKDLSLTYLSDVFKKSPSYLSGLFKSENDIGLAEYINLERINEAKRLLEETNIPVNVISAKVGFLSYSSFSRVFKKIVGVSASEYHKRPHTD